MSTAETPGRHHHHGHRRRALLAAGLSALLFGSATPLSKSLLEAVPPPVLAGLFYLGAALALLPGVLAASRARAREAGPDVEPDLEPDARADVRADPQTDADAVAAPDAGTGRRTVHPAACGPLGWPGDPRTRRLLGGAILFGGLLGPLLLLLGLERAAASSVAMLLNLETVATALLGLLIFREHLGPWSWVGNAGVLTAGVLLSLEGGQPGLVGALLVAAAALCWGLDNQCTALIDGLTPVESTFWKGLVAGAVNLALGLAVTGAAPGLAWAAALVVGGVAYGASIVLYISAAQDLGASRAQMIFASSPAFGVAGAVLILGEGLSGLQLAAGVVLAVSIGMLLLDDHEHVHLHEPVDHEHAHTHGGRGDDGHHHPDPDHGHGPVPAGTRHSHAHGHAPVEHAHPHWSDLHHRHDHEPG